MPKIDLSQQAAHFLTGQSAKKARKIAGKLKMLGDDPVSLPSEAMKGYAPLRRLTSGRVRIIFAAGAETVEIHLVARRDDDEMSRALERTWKKQA